MQSICSLPAPVTEYSAEPAVGEKNCPRNCEKPWNGKLLKAVAVDVYNQTIDGDVACAVTAAVGGANTSGAKVIVYPQN